MSRPAYCARGSADLSAGLLLGS